MKLVAIVFAALVTLGATSAYANCSSAHCADGYTWSSDAGSCVPKSVSS